LSVSPAWERTTISATITACTAMATTGAPDLGSRRPKAGGSTWSIPAANGRRAATPNQAL